MTRNLICNSVSRRSKIFLSIGYPWTGRGPEITNGAGAADGPAVRRGLLVVALRTGRGPKRGRSGRRWDGVTIMGQGTVRRRSRQGASRPRVVQFSLTVEEFGEVSRAAEGLGMARGAFAAEAVLAAARGGPAPVSSPLRGALVEVMTAAGLVRRAGTNLNQAVARLNAT